MIMTIGFQKLKISCIIGILEHERQTEQDIFCDLEVDVDVDLDRDTDRDTDGEKDPARGQDSGETASTLDYRELADFAADTAVSGSYRLLENLAADMIKGLQLQYPNIRAGTLEIRKPRAIADAQAALIRVKW